MNIKSDDFTLAVANLAAAAMAADPGLSMGAAVSAARETLIKTPATLSPKQIADSVRPDKILCFEDDTWHIMLRRYLRRKFNMSPEQYRAKWGLSDSYPFVAPNYAKTRSAIAKKSGLGRK